MLLTKKRRGIPIKIAVDSFGGDYAPEKIVEGALQAGEMYQISTILTGDEQKLNNLVSDKPGSKYIEIVHAPQIIQMDDHPVEAVRAKKASSLMVAARLVRDKQAVGMISAGNTGAAMAASVLGIGRIRGIERPAITSLMPTLHGVCLLVDVGANVDCRPNHLIQFAYMGSVYAQRVLEVDNPKVGLLNIGEEPSKGNEVAQKVYDELSKSNLNFIGNVEGRDIPKGEVDVIVCDGFVGNIVLKFAEGIGSVLFGMLREEFTRSLPTKLAALILKPGLRNIKRKMDYAEYGGAPLLGVNGVSIIAHGSSNAKAIRNAIRVAKEAAEHGVINTIEELMEGENR